MISFLSNPYLASFDLSFQNFIILKFLSFSKDGILQEHYASHPPKTEDVVDMFAFEVFIGGKMNEKTAKLHGVFFSNKQPVCSVLTL